MAKVMILVNGGLQRMIVKNIVRDLGHETLEMDKAYKGLREYDGFRPDLVVASDQLPDMDGIDVLAEFLAKDANAKVIMLISVDHMERAMEVMQAGAVGHAFLPLNRLEFAEALEAVLG